MGSDRPILRKCSSESKFRINRTSCQSPVPTESLACRYPTHSYTHISTLTHAQEEREWSKLTRCISSCCFSQSSSPPPSPDDLLNSSTLTSSSSACEVEAYKVLLAMSKLPFANDSGANWKCSVRIVDLSVLSWEGVRDVRELGEVEGII